MVNAGRILIIAKGAWDSLTSYEQLDLVTRNDTAYLARQGSVGVDPATDTAMTYWQPFGTAVKIATTSVPGIVMPDGTTITIDETGLITAALGVSDLKNVAISSIANGQILQYNSSTQKWENKSLGSAASRNATSSITSGSTDLIESGAVNSLKQTLETNLTNLGNVAYQTSDSAETSVDDADYIPFYDTSAQEKKKILVSNLNLDNDAKADKSNLASISITGTTNNTGSTITKGTFFYKGGILVKAILDIADGATLTSGTNYEDVTAGGLNSIMDSVAKLPDFSNIITTLTCSTSLQTYTATQDCVISGRLTAKGGIGDGFINRKVDSNTSYMLFGIATGNMQYDVGIYFNVFVKKGWVITYVSAAANQLKVLGVQ